MPILSAGLLMCRVVPKLQFFLIHPGGPYYANKNEGSWSIPKGLAQKDEDLLACAQREFREETGIEPTGPFQFLGTTKMKSGKIIHAWSFIGEWNPADGIKSNTFPLEWPPHSGEIILTPEADKGDWCSFEKALKLIHPSQKYFIEKAIDLYK